MTFVYLGDEEGIHLMISPADGKITGEAYVELSEQEDIAKALKYDRKNIDRRYIEGIARKQKSLLIISVITIFLHFPVFEMETENEFVDAMERQKSIQRDHETIVRLRGLPYEVSNDEIKNFFEGE
jgi:RNA recognition motif-containing protein